MTTQSLKFKPAEETYKTHNASVPAQVFRRLQWDEERVEIHLSTHKTHICEIDNKQSVITLLHKIKSKNK